MTPIRVFYFCIGWVFFGTGLIGAFVPVLPTTIFMILSLWMFSKSSQRFHDWLYTHNQFGPALQRWHQYRVIPICAKLTAVSMMSLSFIIVLMYSNLPWWGMSLIGVFLLYAACYVTSKPSRVPEGENDVKHLQPVEGNQVLK